MNTNDYDVPNMETIDLEDLRDELEIALAEMRAKIEFTEGKQADGEEVDIDWLRRTRYARRMHNVLYVQAARELKQRKGEMNRLRDSDFPRKFLKAAQRILNPETFQVLSDIANDTNQAEGENG